MYINAQSHEHKPERCSHTFYTENCKTEFSCKAPDLLVCIHAETEGVQKGHLEGATFTTPKKNKKLKQLRLTQSHPLTVKGRTLDRSVYALTTWFDATDQK